ncbi:MAG: hypothetical protein J0H68_07440 [Sphingobacteriia bacterium]|nr:hypothetical protein [Sphingobacteriia bacterium]
MKEFFTGAVDLGTKTFVATKALRWFNVTPKGNLPLWAMGAGIAALWDSASTIFTKNNLGINDKKVKGYFNDGINVLTLAGTIGLVLNSFAPMLGYILPSFTITSAICVGSALAINMLKEEKKEGYKPNLFNQAESTVNYAANLGLAASLFTFIPSFTPYLAATNTSFAAQTARRALSGAPTALVNFVDNLPRLLAAAISLPFIGTAIKTGLETMTLSKSKKVVIENGLEKKLDATVQDHYPAELTTSFARTNLESNAVINKVFNKVASFIS